MNPFPTRVVRFGTDESVPYGGCVSERMNPFPTGVVRFGTDESVPYGGGAFRNG